VPAGSCGLDRFGWFDLLDNAVRIGSRSFGLHQREQRWPRMMPVNVESRFPMAKHAVSAMIKADAGPSVRVIQTRETGQRIVPDSMMSGGIS
jgi:hypothetical protein